MLEQERYPERDEYQRPNNVPRVAVNHSDVFQQKQDAERKYNQSQEHRHLPQLTTAD